MLKSTPLVMKNRPAALMQLAAKDKKARQIINNPDPDFEKDAEELVAGLNGSEIVDIIDKAKKAVKHSMWSDLADYYLALQYIFNIVDNDLGWNFNRRVGAEMIDSFISVENVYAARFLKYNMNSMGLSSQTVDDK